MAIFASFNPAARLLSVFSENLDNTITMTRNVAGTLLANGNAVPIQGRRAMVANACHHCGGRFGMVTHRWWGNKFCKRTCKDAYLRELALGRAKIYRWLGLLSRGNGNFMT